MNCKPKLIRTSTVAMSLDILLKGQLAFLNQYYTIIAVSGKDDHLKNVEIREKVQIKSIKIERKISPLKDLVSLFRLYIYFKNQKPKIVHSITPKAGLLSIIAAFFAGVPIRIHTFTGLIFPYKKGIFQALLITMDKILCKFATHIIPEGQGVKNDLIKFKITKKPLEIIGNGNVNGIDLEYFNPNLYNKFELREKYSYDKNDFVFIFVGRLVADKGINELINTFEKVSVNSPNFKLILVGTFEPKLDPIKPETILKINQNKNINHVGYQADIRPLLALADVFVFPSYREGFPNVVLQAGAMNLPCIVTNISGCNEIISDHKNGLIVEPKNEIDLENSMLKLYNNTELFKTFQTNSRKNITEKYNQFTIWNALLQKYKAIENI